MSGDAHKVTAQATLQAVADRLALIGAPQAPLYAAAAASQIALIVIAAPDAAWPADTIARLTRPTVVVLSGDPGWGEPTFGPGRWRCAKKLRTWAGMAVIHGAAGEADHYRQAVLCTALIGHVAFIETTSSLAQTWNAFMAPVPRIGFLPSEGAHPVTPTVRH